MTGTIAVAGPVQAHERIQLLDVLRGFALLGILQVNWENTDGTLTHLIGFFGTGSFYTTYSFLFGFGFAVQLIRAGEARRPFILRYLWRTLILLGIGAIHAIFIWSGDILVAYALVAPVLLVVRTWKPGVVIALASAWLTFAVAPEVPDGHVWTRVNPERVEERRLHTQLDAAAARVNPPAWCEVIPGLTSAYRSSVCAAGASFQSHPRRMARLGWWQGSGEILCMFLLGLFAGRKRLLNDAARHTRLLATVAVVGLVFGISGNALQLFGDFFGGKGIALPRVLTDDWRLLYPLGSVGLSLFYLSSLTLLFTHWRRAARIAAPLASVGRMGLTNYLAQSVLFMTILGPRGFGIMDNVEGWYSLLLLNAFFVVQIAYSRWWFTRFQLGPVEWAWRSLTWVRFQPMRIPAHLRLEQVPAV